MDEYDKFIKEDKIAYKEEQKKKCNEEIAAIKEEISSIEAEMQTLSQEIGSLKAQKSQEFHNSRGFTEKYYSFDVQIDAKENEKDKKQDEIFDKEVEIVKVSKERII